MDFNLVVVKKTHIATTFKARVSGEFLSLK
jgi:hypothetical protein